MTTTLPLEPKRRFAGEIKRHPEVETLLVSRAGRTEVLKKVLDRLPQGVN